VHSVTEAAFTVCQAGDKVTRQVVGALQREHYRVILCTLAYSATVAHHVARLVLAGMFAACAWPFQSNMHTVSTQYCWKHAHALHNATTITLLDHPITYYEMSYSTD
jgi:hypothetical protein